MTDPTRLPNSWSFPTPQQALTLLFVLAVAVRESGVFADDGVGAKVCGAIVLACGLLGISSAKQYLSPRVLSILEKHDPPEGPPKG